MCGSQQVRRRDLGLGLEQRAVLRQRTDDLQASGTANTGNRRGQVRPCNGQIQSQRALVVLLICKLCEALQLFTFDVQLIAHGSASL